MLERPDTSADKITGPSLFSAYMKTFKADVYKGSSMRRSTIFGLYQVLLSGLVGVILLYLLITILEHIHAHVAPLYKSERFQAKCRLMNENALIFNRKKIFSNTKYIVRVESENSK